MDINDDHSLLDHFHENPEAHKWWAEYNEEMFVYTHKQTQIGARNGSVGVYSAAEREYFLISDHYYTEGRYIIRRDVLEESRHQVVIEGVTPWQAVRLTEGLAAADEWQELCSLPKTGDLLCPNCGASASLPLGVTCKDHNPEPVTYYEVILDLHNSREPLQVKVYATNRQEAVEEAALYFGVDASDIEGSQTLPLVSPNKEESCIK